MLKLSMSWWLLPPPRYWRNGTTQLSDSKIRSNCLNARFESEPLKATLATDSCIGAMISPNTPGKPKEISKILTHGKKTTLKWLRLWLCPAAPCDGRTRGHQRSLGLPWGRHGGCQCCHCQVCYGSWSSAIHWLSSGEGKCHNKLETQIFVVNSNICELFAFR